LTVSVSPPLFSPTVLPITTASVIYTAPSSPASIVVARMRVRFTNTSNASVSVTAYAVPSAGSPTAGNECLAAEAIAQNMHLDLDIPMLGPGWTFHAFASAATAITCSLLDAVTFS